jgi:hypothetical protein
VCRSEAIKSGVKVTRVHGAPAANGCCALMLQSFWEGSISDILQSLESLCLLSPECDHVCPDWPHPQEQGLVASQGVRFLSALYHLSEFLAHESMSHHDLAAQALRAWRGGYRKPARQGDSKAHGLRQSHTSSAILAQAGRSRQQQTPSSLPSPSS